MSKPWLWEPNPILKMFIWCYHSIYFKTGPICLPKFISIAPALRNTSAPTQELLFKDFAVDSSCRLSRNYSHFKIYFKKIMHARGKTKQKTPKILQRHEGKLHLFPSLSVVPLARNNHYYQFPVDPSKDILRMDTYTCDVHTHEGAYRMWFSAPVLFFYLTHLRIFFWHQYIHCTLLATYYYIILIFPNSPYLWMFRFTIFLL